MRPTAYASAIALTLEADGIHALVNRGTYHVQSRNKYKTLNNFKGVSTQLRHVCYQHALRDLEPHEEVLPQANSHQRSKVASEVAVQLYPGCPKLYNELINRAKPSGAAVAARKKLMVKMVDDYFEKDLAIEGTPPEMAMYKSCLQHLNLHVDSDDGTDF